MELSRAYLDEYNDANHNGGKAIVARKVVQELLYPSNGQSSDGGRFLQRREDKVMSGWWEEVTDEQVMIAKATHALRGIRKRNNRLTERFTTRYSPALS